VVAVTKLIGVLEERVVGKEEQAEEEERVWSKGGAMRRAAAEG
jgi:hypothetical protein